MSPSSRSLVANLTGYEILEVLGRGGMGVVYKARQVGLNRLVALKMILAGSHASVQELNRFKIEAQAVARLQHANIVQIYDINDRDGRPYFSLEYCAGGSLQEKLKGAPMKPRLAAELIETLARALHFAHEKGIVHRDIKPANILLTGDGTPKITDFGLAKLMESDQGQTGTEAILGTPMYMAPEQARGHTRHVGPGADIYALGAVFYDLLTGRPPFRGTSALDTLQMVQSAEPIPPARLQPGVPGDLQTVCLKCLEKEPGKRYASAGALAGDLRRYLDGLPIQARPASSLERTWKWARRRPTLAGLIVLAILAPLLITAISVAFTLSLMEANTQINNQNLTLTNQKEELDETNKTLEQQKRDLVQTQQALQTKHNSLVKAMDRVLKAEKSSQQNFLAALDAVEDLIRLARGELRAPGNELVRRTLLTQAILMCQRFSSDARDTPATLYRAARAERLIGELEAAMGRSAESIKSHEKAIALFKQLLAGGAEAYLPGTDYLQSLLECQTQLWGVLEASNPTQAERLLFEALARIDQVDPQTLKRPEYQCLHGVLLGDRAIHHQRRGQIMLALRDYDQAIRLLEALPRNLTAAEIRTRDQARHDQLELARFLTNRSAVRMDGQGWWLGNQERRLAVSCQDAEQAIALLQRLLKVKDDVAVASELGRAYVNLATAWSLRKNPKQARITAEKAVALFQKLSSRAPLAVDYQHLLALARGQLGGQMMLQGASEAGRKELKASQATLAQLADAFPDTASFRIDLARQWLTEGVGHIRNSEVDAGVDAFNTSSKLLHQVLARDPENREARTVLLSVHANLIFCHYRLARLAERQNDEAEARRQVALLVYHRQQEYQNQPPLSSIPGTWPRALFLVERIGQRVELAGTLRTYARFLEKAEDHQGAARIIAELRPLLAPTWPGWASCAAQLSRCMKLAGKDTKLSSAQRTRLMDQYGRQALEILNGLVPAFPPGLADRLELSEFAALRERFSAEVRQLLERVRNQTQMTR